MLPSAAPIRRSSAAQPDALPPRSFRAGYSRPSPAPGVSAFRRPARGRPSAAANSRIGDETGYEALGLPLSPEILQEGYYHSCSRSTDAEILNLPNAISGSLTDNQLQSTLSS